MSHDNRDNIDFGNGDVKKLFGTIFVPTLLGMLFNMAFILTDGIFVGHGIGANGLASINLIAPIMMLVNGTGAMMGIGASVVAAIHLSKENIKAARINVTQAFIASALVGMAMGLVLYACPDAVLHILGVSDTLHLSTKEYYLWFIPTCLLFLIETLGMFVIRLDGSPRYAMMANIIPAVVNIALDFTFIFPCHMGLRGAALATDCGGLVGVAMVAYYMLFRVKTLRLYRLKLSKTSLALSLRNVGYMVKVGFSGFVGEVAVSVMMLMGNIMFAHAIGDHGVAAWSVACYIFPLIYMVYLAISQSAQPIISFNYGISQRDRVVKTFRHSLVIAFVGGLIFTLFMVAAPQVVISAFLDSSAEAFPIATHGISIFALGFIFTGINIGCIGYLQSIERSNSATVLMILRGIALPVLLFLLLPHCWNVDGLWLALPIAEAITTVVIFLVLTKAKRS